MPVLSVHVNKSSAVMWPMWLPVVWSSDGVCVQGSTCTNKVLIHHRQHAQVTVYTAVFSRSKLYWCEREKKQQNKDKGGFTRWFTAWLLCPTHVDYLIKLILLWHFKIIKNMTLYGNLIPCKINICFFHFCSDTCDWDIKPSSGMWEIKKKKKKSQPGPTDYVYFIPMLQKCLSSNPQQDIKWWVRRTQKKL